jgi:hypothetical protein
MLACTLLVALVAPVPQDLSSGPARQPAPAPATPAPGSEPIPARHLKIAGGVTLGLAGAAFGVMIGRIVAAAAFRRPLGVLADATADREPTAAEAEALQTLQQRQNGVRYQALGLGLGGAVLTAVGVALVVAGHRAARRPRISAAPWWLPGGGGLTLHVVFGAP